ncbi:MAG: hypothetical protein LBV30_01500 [Propionibacteriaceae bacterium]|jgi:hypothetical protein|nr:hypothetical protein [Propionibacteriaceae bacterium]
MRSVDDEKVRQAMQGLTHANRLLVAAVQTTLDAEVALIRATQHAPTETQSQIVDEPNRRWRASTRNLKLRPKTATSASPTISPDAISDALSNLKGLIAAISIDWCQRNDTDRRQDTQGKPRPRRPIIGSREWHSHLEMAHAYHTDPDAKDWLPDDAIAAAPTAKRIADQDPGRD